VRSLASNRKRGCLTPWEPARSSASRAASDDVGGSREAGPFRVSRPAKLVPATATRVVKAQAENARLSPLISLQLEA